jgi:phage terminase large subunit-like protein
MTLSLNAVLVGSVAPSLSAVTRGVRNPQAVEALDVASIAGLDLDEWQAETLVASMALASDGSARWAAREVGVVVGRQNGKGSILEVRQLAGLFVLGEKLQVHSAHEFKTCYEHFRRIKDLIQGCDLLAAEVAIIRTGAGDQAIELKSGARIRFVARSRSSGRGFTADTVYLDEAFKLDDSTMGALLPTLSARPNSQVWYTSSAPHADSPVLHRIRRRALEGDDPRLLYLEWGNDPDVAADDVEAWARANPAMGIRIDVEDIAAELRSMSAAEFARERLGIPEPEPSTDLDLPIDPELWAGLVDAESLPVSEVRLALDSPPDLSAPVFAVAGIRDDGLRHVSVRERINPGAGPVREQIVEAARRLCDEHSAVDVYGQMLPARLVIPTGSPARAWKAELVAAGVELDELSAGEFAEGCGALRSLVADGVLRHRGQMDMNRAIAGLATRTAGDGVDVWSRRNSEVNVSPIVAATCALMRVPQADEQVGAFFVDLADYLED